jgi:hypothetical protein
MSNKIGKKYDMGKLRFDLFPDNVLPSVLKVLMHGAEIYGEDNWKFVKNFNKRYYAAAMRHLNSWKFGKVYDKNTGISHLAHAICCLSFLLSRQEEKTVYISGPMTGHYQYNFNEFFKIETLLQSKGWIVFNPARLSWELSYALKKNLIEISKEEFMKVDLAAISKCNNLILLKGWEKSKGCQIEIKEAKKRKLNIFTEKELDQLLKETK